VVADEELRERERERESRAKPELGLGTRSPPPPKEGVVPDPLALLSAFCVAGQRPAQNPKWGRVDCEYSCTLLHAAPQA
jgi:hypothetical protein